MEMADRTYVIANKMVAMNQLLIISIVYSGMMYWSNGKLPVTNLEQLFFSLNLLFKWKLVLSACSTDALLKITANAYTQRLL